MDNENNFVDSIIRELQFSKNINLTTDEKFIDSYLKMENILNTIIKEFTPIIMDKFYELSLTPKCNSGLLKSFDAFANNKEWILKMLDSNGHFPSGLLSGTLTSLGDYDQCLSVHNEEYDIFGKYCLLKVRPSLPKKNKIITFNDRFFNLNGTKLQNTWVESLVNKQMYAFYYYNIINGICIPSICSEDDITQIVQQIFSPFHLIVEIDSCVTEHDQHININNGQIIAIIIISLFIFSSLISTLFDLMLSTKNNGEESIFIKIYQSFSLKRNTQKLFDNSSKSHKTYSYNFQFIHGMKVISIIWVIIGHTYISGALLITKGIPTANLYHNNLIDVINVPKQFVTQIIVNAVFAVDIFFFISGLLVVYVTVSKINDGKYDLKFCNYIFLRWIRLIPLLTGIICIHLLFPLLGSGPFFHSKYTDLLTNPCYYNWWRNILFISNWFPLEEQCMIHTWYLSADFQYYLIAYLLLIIISYNIRIGTYSSLGLTFIGLIIPTIIAYVKQFPPANIYQADIEDLAKKSSQMHYQSYNHLTSYFFGSFIGCLLLKKNELNIHYILRKLLWVLTMSGSVIVLFITYIWANLEWDYSLITASLYFGFHRFIWTAGIAWIAFNCAHNRGGVINSILSSQVFQITSRLTYSIYLSHMIIIWYNFFRLKHLLTASHYDMLFTFCGVYGFTLIMAYICHIVFEAPIDNLVQLLLFNKYENKNVKQLNRKKFSSEKV